MLRHHVIAKAACLVVGAPGAVLLPLAIAAGNWKDAAHAMLWLMLGAALWELMKQHDATAAALQQARESLHIAQATTEQLDRLLAERAQAKTSGPSAA